jgi:outer membrane lipoprotein SlyB
MESVGKLAILSALVGGLALTGCAVPVTRTVHVYDAPGMGAPPPPRPVVHYGTVSRIEVIDTQQQVSGGGAVLGAVIGGVVGNQIGRGAGNALATAAGVFGGAVAGNRLEQDHAAANSSTVYRVYVDFDDGARRHFDYRDLAGLRAGERVRFEHGVLDRA